MEGCCQFAFLPQQQINMKTVYPLILSALFIIAVNARDIFENTLPQITTAQNLSLLQSFQRNLQSTQHEVQYALQIPGFQYLGIFHYLLAFRIVGMQNLFIWQLVQLYQENLSQTQHIYFEVGDFVHGYSNLAFFAIQGFGYGPMFRKLNLIWEISVILFIIAIVMKHIVAPWYKNKILKMKEQENRKIQIQFNLIVFQGINTQETQMNLMEPRSTIKNINSLNIEYENFPKGTELTIKPEKQMIESRFSRKDTIRQNNEASIVKKMARSSVETGNGSNMRQLKSKIKQGQDFVQQRDVSKDKISDKQMRERVNFQEPLRQKQTLSKSLKKQQKKSITNSFKKYKKLTLYSNTILTQLVFYLLINSLTLISYSSTKEHQTASSQPSRITFSGYMITVSSLVMFLYVFKLVLEKGKGSGETKGKFVKENWANRVGWGMVIGERVVYAVVIGSGWECGIGVVCGVKLGVVIVAKFVNVWANEQDYYRNLVINFIQLLVFMVLTLDQYYFSQSRKINLSKQTIAFVLLSLLGLCSIVSFVFFLKDVGVAGWIGGKLRIGEKSGRNREVEANVVDDRLGDNQGDNEGRRVKFVESKAREQARQENGDVTRSSRKTQKSIKATGPSLKSLTTLKSMGTLYQSQIKPSLKSSSNIQPHLTSSRLTITSQSSTTQNKLNSSAKKTSCYVNQPNNSNKKLQTRMDKEISRVIDDALRAQKTHHVIFEEEESGVGQGWEEDVVSIRMGAV